MTITENGVVYQIDEETGEVLSAEAPGFAVEDAKSAEWVLERLQEQDALIAALNAREKAIRENIDAERRRIEHRRNGLLYRFKGELEAFARDNLPKGKKSWVCPFGVVQFRTQAARLKVADPEKALAWAKAYDPDAVKVIEEFQISKLNPAFKSRMMEDSPSSRETAGLDLSPETETCQISTGLD